MPEPNSKITSSRKLATFVKRLGISIMVVFVVLAITSIAIGEVRWVTFRSIEQKWENNRFIERRQSHEIVILPITEWGDIGFGAQTGCGRESSNSIQTHCHFFYRNVEHNGWQIISRNNPQPDQKVE